MPKKETVFYCRKFFSLRFDYSCISDNTDLHSLKCSKCEILVYVDVKCLQAVNMDSGGFYVW